MAEGRDNNVYGVTATGGVNNKGMIFKIPPAGGLSPLYSFDGTHGSTPVGGLTLGPDGNLYGMAEEGGANGFGNIFKITPSGVLTVLYDFTGNADGGLPVSPLIVGADGNLYGTSYPGAAFMMTPQGAFHVIAKTPTSSFGQLLEAIDGSFYGVTEFGGSYSAGSIYRITGSTSTIIHSFDGPNGSFPIGGLVEGADGNFYGTTTAGGSSNAGVIYRITPAGVFTVVVNFDGVHTQDGYEAFAGLIAGADGNLYGATIWGGYYGYGVIFSMSTDGDYSVLYSFDVPHGNGAYATPIQHTNGEIFGMTKRGGAALDGVVYSFSHAAPFVLLSTGIGLVGSTVGLLGQGFSSASSVEFNGIPASFHVISDTFMTAAVPAGETGFVRVNMSSGDLTSSSVFHVTPQLTQVFPQNGVAGDKVTLTGSGLIQTETITVGGQKVTSFTVNSDSEVTIQIPAAAKTGQIALTTPGGNALSSGVFTVNEAAVLTSPAPGSTLNGSNAAFTWSGGTGVSEYELWVGSTGAGSSNLFYPGLSTGTTETVTGLPANAETLYVRLYSKINGSWQYHDYTYKATGTPAVLTSPAHGSTLTSSSVAFSWSAGFGVTEYELWVGSAGAGSSNLNYPGVTTGTTETVTGLPANGATLYVRLYSKIAGAWQYHDYTYFASRGTPAVLTTPTPGATLTSSSVAFSWSAGIGVTEYELWLGSVGAGSSNLNYPGLATSTTETVSGLPTNGATLYVRLYSKVGGAWQYHDYTYTAQ